MHVLEFEIFRIMKVLKMTACKLLEWILEPSLGSSDWLRIVKKGFGDLKVKYILNEISFFWEVQNGFWVASYIMQSNKLQVGGHLAWVQTYLTWGSCIGDCIQLKFIYWSLLLVNIYGKVGLSYMFLILKIALLVINSCAFETGLWIC